MDYIKTKKGRVRPFSKGKGTGQVEFILTIHRFRKTKPKLKNILELYGAFATNMGLKEAMVAWSELPELYKRRWGIETGYRVDGEFRALTTSRNSKVRYLYYQYMVFLGNVWVLGNFWGVSGMGWRVLRGGGFGFVWGSFVPSICLGLCRIFYCVACNRFIKPQSLNMKSAHQLSLRGPNVLVLAILAYGDGSTHIKMR